MQGQVCSAWPRHQESRNDSEARPWPSVRGSAARDECASQPGRLGQTCSCCLPYPQSVLEVDRLGHTLLRGPHPEEARLGGAHSALAGAETQGCVSALAGEGAPQQVCSSRKGAGTLCPSELGVLTSAQSRLLP